jgi:hypothetical protein
MKKILVIFLVLMIPIISAAEVDLVKPTYNQHEILVAKISGIFLENIKDTDVFFYRTHVKVPVEFILQKIDGDYFIYAFLEDKVSSNYSLSIEDVSHMKGQEVTDEAINQTFEILGDQAEFKIDKAVISTNETFSIEVQNLKESFITIYLNKIVNKSETNISEEEFTYEREIVLQSGEIQNIEFEPEQVTEPTWTSVKLSSDNTEYEILIYNLAGDVDKATEEEEEWEGEVNNEQEANISEEEQTEEEKELEEEMLKSTNCVELNGVFCNATQVCEEDNVKYTKDGECCLSKCIIKTESEMNWSAIGWIILFLLVFIIVWFFKTKYSRTGSRKVNLLGFLKKKK